MLVECILPHARKRLATIESSATLGRAAELMATPHVDLLVVCDGAAMIGVITKTDIVVHVSRSPAGGFDELVENVMARDVIYCQANDPLADVWRAMRDHGFQRIPIVGSTRAPIGVVLAGDVLRGLLREAENEDELLRHYISGVGYQ